MTDENRQDKDQDINLAEMSDDEISNIDYTALGEEPEEKNSSPEDELGVDLGTAAADDVEEGNAEERTGGADSSDAPDDANTGSAASTSSDDDADKGNVDYFAEQRDSAPEDHQASDKDDSDSVKADPEPKSVEPKDELAKIYAPFKAANRTVTVNSAEDVRSLMQKGVDYARKMQDMKPYMRVLKTLESNGLLDEAKVNFLIDLDKKNPAAVKKFLKDSEIDPMDLDFEDDTNDYKPTDHMVGDKEIALNEVLDSIRETDVFPRTVNIITKEWDSESRQVLMDEPEHIKFINEHVQTGIYDQIMDVVENEKLLGRVPPGLSTLDAYKAVGSAMDKAGAFRPVDSTLANSGTDQGFSQDSGSRSSNDDELRNRKKAASPTKGSAGTGKQKIDLSKMSDADIEKLNFADL